MSEPKAEADVDLSLPQGRRCPSCGSANTTQGNLLRPKPNLLYLILIGWIVLLVRGAFAMRTDLCRDCGTENRYKSVGSWLALASLILLLVIVWAAVAFDFESLVASPLHE